MSASGTTHELQFAAVYNDLERYPTLRHVAEALGKTRKTVRNFSAILCRRHEAGVDVPALIWRGTADPMARMVAPPASRASTAR